jgi:Protein of unknown function (DUF3047)
MPFNIARQLWAVCTFMLVCLQSAAQQPVSWSSAAAGSPPAPWVIVGLPQRFAKPITQFDVVELEGQQTLRVRADKSWGTVVHPISEIAKPSTLLKWRWRLEQPLAKSDIHSKATEDSALKVCISFDMPTDNIPHGERAIFKLAQFLSKEKIPTATLCYLWGGAEPIGYEQVSLFTSRVRFVVLANESSSLKTWQSKERHIYTDFLKAFGRESSTVPAISAIIIGADADNTQGISYGYVGDVQLTP